MLNAARSELFAAALAIHHSFIEAAREPIRKNISIWIDALNGSVLAITEQQRLAVWQTGFLIIPVLSTTFASVGTMLRHFAANAFGWVIVDEAGQASPQQAVGALWRTRRAVIVGDPLQIPPVVTLDGTIIERLRQFFDVPHELAPNGSISTQTVADRVNEFGTIYRDRETGEAYWVGSPLLFIDVASTPCFTFQTRSSTTTKWSTIRKSLRD